MTDHHVDGRQEGAALPAGGLHPQRLRPADLARILTALGTMPIEEAAILADVAAGAPTNPDGTINLVHYAAWLVKGLGRGD